MGWHGDSVDKYGNVKCLKCGKAQSPSFLACIYCCPHNNLEFDEDYDQRWRLSVFCADCGKNWGFSIQCLINKYRIIKKA